LKDSKLESFLLTTLASVDDQELSIYKKQLWLKALFVFKITSLVGFLGLLPRSYTNHAMNQMTGR